MAEINDMGGIPVDNLTQALLDNEASASAWWSSENAKLRKDVERLQAQVAAARVAVGNLPPYPHTQLRCSPSEGCHCTSDASNTARIEARRALGLEVSP